MDLKAFIEEARSGSLNADEFAHKAIEEARRIQDRYSPFITIAEEAAASRSGGMLQSVPVSVKDCICTSGMRTTAGSRILDSYLPPFDATSVSRIKGEGALLVGKTAQDEFGFGTFSTNCAYSVPRNPHDVSRSCGGSSGGAACAVAASELPHVAIAESTGGSITAPSSFTGIVGITPTYGRVSRHGLIDYSSSMDKIGSMGKKVYDAALALSVMAGHDPLDSTSLKAGKEDFTSHVGREVRGMRIGIPKEYLENVDAQVEKLFHESSQRLSERGASIEGISLPLTDVSLPAYYIIAVSEASTNLARYSGLRYGAQSSIEGSFRDYFSKVRSGNLGTEAKRRIILGTYARAAGFRDAHYMKALKVRARIIEEFRRAFSQVDAIVAPSMPTIAPRFSDIEGLTPLETYRMDRLTTAPNLAGIPTVSLPMGTSEGMPVGLQVMAGHMREGAAISVASALED